MPRWAVSNDDAVWKFPVRAIWMRGVVSFNCDCHYIRLWNLHGCVLSLYKIRSYAYSIYVGGATGSMGSLLPCPTLYKTRNHCLPNSEKLRKTPVRDSCLLPCRCRAAACPCPFCLDISSHSLYNGRVGKGLPHVYWCVGA